jgi:transaldolase
MNILDKIKIFYDGVAVEKYGNLPFVKGFTTNTSFMKTGNKLNYTEFMNVNKDIINNRPISLQIWEDDDEKAYADALAISKLGDNVYVKVPIIKSNGIPNKELIQRLLLENIKINVTAIFTIDQAYYIYDIVKDTTVPIIISIFSGRISDTCVNPIPIVKYVTDLYKSNPNIEILWAGCKETLSIQHALDSGCQIITVPDSIMDRLSRINKDLNEFSKETVISFNNDGKNIII